MTEFTSNIGSVTNRIRTQDPGPRGPSFLAGLADTASTAIEGVSGIMENRERSRLRRAAEADEAEQDRIRGRLNVAIEASDLFARGVSSDSELVTNPAVRSSMERFQAYQDRFEQNGDRAQFRTAVEMELSRLRQEDPTIDLTEFSDLLSESGLNLANALQAERRTQTAIEAANREDYTNRLARARQYFTEDQFDDLGEEAAVSSMDVVIAAEQAQTERRTYVENLAAIRTSEETISQFDREALERDRARMETNWLRSQMDELNVRFGAEANRIERLRQEGAGPEEIASAYRGAVLELRQYAQEIVGDSEGISVGGIESFQEQIDYHLQVIEAYSSDNTYQEVVDSYLAQTRLELYEAIPVLASLQAMDPSGQMILSLAQDGILAAISRPELRQQYTDYLAGRRPEPPTADIPQGYEQVFEDVALLSGPGGTDLNNPRVREARERMRLIAEGDLETGTPEEVQERAIPILGILETMAQNVAQFASPSRRGEMVSGAVVDAATQNAAAPFEIVGGVIGALDASADERARRDQERRYSGVDQLQQSAMAGSEGSITPREYSRLWIRSARYLIENELSPNQPNPRDEIAQMRRWLFSPANMQAIQNSATEEPELMQAVMGTAFRLLDSAEGYQPSRLGIGSPRVNFDQETGRFVVTNVREEAGTATWAGGIGREFSDLMASEANALLDQMLSLSDLDPNISGLEMSDLERRKYLVSGEIPEAKSGSSENKTEGASATESGTMEDYIGMTIDQEGGSHSTGYIPTGGSGVTIGAGLDLGQHTADDLTRMGISAPTIEKLEPYLGLSTRAAVEAQGLSPEGLQLTPEEEAEINEAVLGNSYNRARSTPAWGNLSDQSRQALVSMRHWAGQLGANSSKLAPAGTNHVWAVLQREDATDEELVAALQATLADMPDPTEARYNRLERLIEDLT